MEINYIQWMFQKENFYWICLIPASSQNHLYCKRLHVSRREATKKKGNVMMTGQFVRGWTFLQVYFSLQLRFVIVVKAQTDGEHQWLDNEERLAVFWATTGEFDWKYWRGRRQLWRICEGWPPGGIRLGDKTQEAYGRGVGSNLPHVGREGLQSGEPAGTNL